MKSNRRAAPDRHGHSSIKSIAAIALSFGLLSGCAALTGTEATSDTFELAASDVSNAQAVRRGTQILIAEPSALKALDSQNIVVETAPLTLQYLDAAQWSDRLPRVVQQKLAASFESSNRFSGVGLPGQGLAIDYQLITEIRDFSVDGRSNVADVTISVKLLDDRSGSVAGSRVFTATARSGSSEQADYVRALNTAFLEVSEEIVVWVASRI